MLLLLLCCWSFSLLRLSSSLIHGHMPVDQGPISSHRSDGPYLPDIERSRVPDSVLDPDLLSADAVEDHFVMEPGSYEEVQQHSEQCKQAQFPLRKLISCIGFAPCRTRLQACSCRAGPCARLAAASLTNSPAWVTLCPAVTPATPVIAASSMPSVTAAK
uniref:Uncharacterized protein n=1 Tax=Oryzias sinensis TaxID=183150 RepID=A0A8C7ZFY3_9TELE